VLQPDHRPVGARRRVAGHVVGGRLEAHGIRTGAQVEPLEERGKRDRVVVKLERSPERAVDQPGTRPAVTVRDQNVLVDLLHEARLRPGQHQVRNALRGDTVGAPGRLGDGGLEPAALGQQRPPHVHVIQEHVRSRVKARVDHGV
jgi:hypothetical protein